MFCPESKIASLLLLFFVVVANVELTGLDFVEDDLVGSLERLLETLVESELSGSSLGLLSTSSLGSLLLESGSAGGLTGLDSLLLGSAESLGGRVEDLHHGLVLERVLLALGREVSVDLLGTKLALDLIGVDNASEVGAGHHVTAELEASLLDSTLTVSTEDVVELLKGVLGEDDESADVTTRGELEEVQTGDVAGVDTGEVASGLLDAGVVVTVDNKRASLEGEAAIAELALTVAELLGGASAVEVTTNADVAEGLEEVGGLLIGEAVDNKRELGDIIDDVTTGLDERATGGGSESGGNSVSLLVGVNLAVPLSPELEGSEHAALTAHVTESTLAGTVSTGTRDTRNTGDGATGTPGLGGVLVASVPVDGVTLSAVLGHVGVAELNEIVTDGGGEHGGHVDGAGDAVVLVGVNAHGRTGSHLYVLRRKQIIIILRQTRLLNAALTLYFLA